jgi:hypothetical protein
MQFAVFQANVNDTFGYLTSAEVFARESFSVISHAVDADFLQQPLWCQACANLSCRPTVMILYAVVGQLIPSAMHETHYTFLAFFFSCTALSITWLLLNLGLARRTWMVTAAMLSGWGYTTGFWGQYILDINAWSQIASMPLLVSLAGILTTLVDHQQDDEITELTSLDHWRNTGVVALVTAAAIYYYPENTAFHLVGLSPVAMWAWFRGKRLPVLRLAGAILAGLALALAYYHGTLAFLFNQTTAAGASNNWWISSLRYCFGRDGWYDGLEVALRKAWEVAYPGMHNDGVAQLVFARSYLETFFHQGDNWRLLVGLPFDALTGFMGLFFLSPLSSWPVPLQVLCRGALFALALILLIGGMRRLFNQRDARVHNIGIFLGTMLLMAGVMVLKRQFWGAGKAISFCSPYLAIFFVLPALLTRNAWVRTAGGLWVAGQLTFGLMRPFWAHDPHLQERTPTYMPVAVSKTTHNFDLKPLMTQLRYASCVELDVPDPYLEHYLMLALYANGIPFRFDHPVNTYFGTSGRNVGLPIWKRPANFQLVEVLPTTEGGGAQLTTVALKHLH